MYDGHAFMKETEKGGGGEREIIDDTLAGRNRMAPQVCAVCIAFVRASNCTYEYLPHGGAVLSGNYP
jgi:hypothetical protein